MDVAEVAKKNWQLIELAAKHDYIPNGMSGQVQELKQVYHGQVDLWCGSCVISMCKWFYNNYKDKV